MKIRKFHLVVIIVCLVAGTVICAGGYLAYKQLSRGNVEQTQVVIEATEHYSEEEIAAACAVIKEAFGGYKWCTLCQLRYHDNECLPIASSFADYHGIETENVIVIRGDFVSGKKELNRPYILPNLHYDDFVWVLTRDNRDAQWRIADAY